MGSPRWRSARPFPMFAAPMSAFFPRSILALIAAAGLVPQSSSFESESRREGETCNTNSDCAGTLRCEIGTCRGVAGARLSVRKERSRALQQARNIEQAKRTEPRCRSWASFCERRLSRRAEGALQSRFLQRERRKVSTLYKTRTE